MPAEKVSYRPLDLAAGALAFLLPVAFSPAFGAPAWSLRAILLCIAAMSTAWYVPGLFGSSLRRPAVAATGFLLVAGIATVRADRPVIAFLGLYNQGTGWLFLASLVGFWAVGTRLSSPGQRLVAFALLAAASVNAGVGVIQRLVDLQSLNLSLFLGQAPGLLGNPVHLGALLAGAAGLLTLPTRRCRAAALALLVGSGLQVSGSRFGAISLVGSLILAGTFTGWRPAIRAFGWVLIGFVLTIPLTGALGRSGTSTVQHVARAQSGDYTDRLATWNAALHVAVDHPLLGSGPNRFLAATGGSRPLSVARHTDQEFADAHNMVVELAVTVGPIGLVLFVVWTFLAVRHSAGPLLAFAVGALAIYLVEPLSIATVPVAFLALGAASRPRAEHGWVPPLIGVMATGLIAVVGSGVFAFGDWELRRAGETFSADQAATAVRLLPPWLEPPQLAGKVAAYQVITGPAGHGFGPAVAWYEVAVRRDPSSPQGWTNLANVQSLDGDTVAAEASYHQALRHDPWNLVALGGLARIGVATAQPPLVASALARAQEVDSRISLVQLTEVGPTGLPSPPAAG